MIGKVLNTHVRVWLNQPDKFAPLQSGGQSWLTQNSLSPPLVCWTPPWHNTCLAAFWTSSRVLFFSLKSSPSSLEMCTKPASECGKCCRRSQSPWLKHKSRKSLTKSVPKSENSLDFCPTTHDKLTYCWKAQGLRFPWETYARSPPPLTFFFLFSFNLGAAVENAAAGKRW